MDGPMSVVFSNIYMCKIKEDIVACGKPMFYKRSVDDTYIRRKKNVNDELFQSLNSYHRNSKLTLEINPRKFLDTDVIRKKNTISTKVSKNLTNIPLIGFPKFQLIITVKLLSVHYVEPYIGLSMTLFSDSTKKKKNC